MMITYRMWVQNNTGNPFANVQNPEMFGGIGNLSTLMQMKYGKFYLREEYTMTEMQNLIKFVESLNSYKYNTLYNTTNKEYNPIENYNMTESELIDDNTIATPNTTVTTTTEGSNNSSTSTTTFDDTANMRPTGSDQSSQTGTSTSTQSGTDKTDKTVTRELTRSGNIGVTTTQQMLEQERNLATLNMCETFVDDCAEMLLIHGKMNIL